jgi:hypothetical protein
MPSRRPRAVPPAFLAELAALGAPARLCARLDGILKKGHPGAQDRIYHCLAHSYEVAELTARQLHSWPKVPAGRKVLLILAAALHDLDPDRAPGTLARVSGTLEQFTKNASLRALIAELGARFDFTAEQTAALVMATDYSAHPGERAKKFRAFRRAHREAFGTDPWVEEWGRRLAYWDQIATYLRNTPAQARRRIAGLGRELRAERVRPESGLKGLSLTFLGGLRRDPLFAYLTRADRARFDAVVRALQSAS